MRYKILAFGIAREIMSGSTIEIECDASNAGQLKSLLEEKYPKLKSLRSFMLAVNEEYANPSLLIYPVDEIAVIPPVSGG